MKLTDSQIPSSGYRRYLYLVLLLLGIIATLIRLEASISEKSLRPGTGLIFGVVLFSLLVLFIQLWRSDDYLHLVERGLFFVVAIGLIFSLIEILFLQLPRPLHTNLELIELIYWFPVASVAAFLAFDARWGLIASLSYWLLVSIIFAVFLFNFEGTQHLTAGLGFIARFIIANTALVFMMLLWARVNTFTVQSETRATLLEQYANTDFLTEIPNRRYFSFVLNQEFERAKRTSNSFSVIMFDVDSFKRINDEFGHDAGDRILVEVASRVQELLRPMDTLARFGGDEFIILLPETYEKNALQIANRLSQMVASEEFPGVGRLTIKCGIATSIDQPDIESILAHADEALYQNKRARHIEEAK